MVFLFGNVPFPLEPCDVCRREKSRWVGMVGARREGVHIYA